MDFTETVKQDRVLYDGRILRLHQQVVELPNGKAAEREIVEHHGAVAILALADLDHAYFVRQWRAPLAHETWEVPAGKIDPLETDPLPVAQRELNEEIGYAAERWQLLSRFYSSPGFATEQMSLYLAQDLQKIAHKRSLDVDEFLEVKLFTLAEIQAYLTSSEFIDAKTLLAVQYWQQLVGGHHE
ncbi:NUDIX hydrolase [Lapidilactobacillus gannanensis]|uniref:NUDIX hydrolase n=1 Tax=Lapidilactobacillus gannanensis TaxID=2486002 RepID=A0ABW4BSP2_9LACO|nr:NUDIX hydrolase [Lapidilactobacillus gannanensis]